MKWEIFRHLGKLARLERPRRGLLLKAFTVVAAVRLALILAPFRALERVLRWRWHDVNSITAAPAVGEIIWAVQAASRWLPAATCLVQALAAVRLLESAGYPASLTIGTAKTSGGELAAHAWVIYRDEVVLGAAGAANYTPILVWRPGHWQAPRPVEVGGS